MARAARIVADHITKAPSVRGGKACIDGTRIRVMDVALLQRQGLAPEEMTRYFSVPLSLTQIQCALTYLYEHPGETETDIADGKRSDDGIELDRALHLKLQSDR